MKNMMMISNKKLRSINIRNPIQMSMKKIPTTIIIIILMVETFAVQYLLQKSQVKGTYLINNNHIRWTLLREI